MQEAYFSAIVIFLDSESYRHIGAETIKVNLDTIANRFRSLPEANICKIEKLLSEFETVFDYVNLFLPTFPHPKYRQISSRNRRSSISKIFTWQKFVLPYFCLTLRRSACFRSCGKYAKEQQSLKNH